MTGRPQKKGREKRSRMSRSSRGRVQRVARKIVREPKTRFPTSVLHPFSVFLYCCGFPSMRSFSIFPHVPGAGRELVSAIQRRLCPQAQIATRPQQRVPASPQWPNGPGFKIACLTPRMCGSSVTGTISTVPQLKHQHDRWTVAAILRAASHHPMLPRACCRHTVGRQ